MTIRRAVCAAVLGIAALVSPAAASADSTHAAGVVHSPPGHACFVGADVTGGQTLSTTDFLVLRTSSGHLMLVCQFRYPEGSEPTEAFKVVEFSGCGTLFGILVGKRSFVATPGGHATLTCIGELFPF